MCRVSSVCGSALIKGPGCGPSGVVSAVFLLRRDTTCRQPCSLFDFYRSKADGRTGAQGIETGWWVLLEKLNKKINASGSK